MDRQVQTPHTIPLSTVRKPATRPVDVTIRRIPRRNTEGRSLLLLLAPHQAAIPHHQVRGSSQGRFRVGAGAIPVAADTPRRTEWTTHDHRFEKWSPPTRRTAILVLSAALALSVIAPAQAAPDGRPAPGLDRAALRAAIEPRPGDSAAGAVAEVHRNGETWRGAAGDVVTGRHISPRAHFRIGSVTKTMEAVILLQLSAEGRVDLLIISE
ncbi:serine hydrolase [Streptomyces sp. NPDC056501]|uniref:serine hydrolase n=1 Tax=Streptomyces sp. NPDC056501 TaxID=3345841 RepID=UPI00368B0A04